MLILQFLDSSKYDVLASIADITDSRPFSDLRQGGPFFFCCFCLHDRHLGNYFRYITYSQHEIDPSHKKEISFTCSLVIKLIEYKNVACTEL